MYRLRWDSVGDRYFYLLWNGTSPAVTIHPYVVNGRNRVAADAVAPIQHTLNELEVPFETWGPPLAVTLTLALGEEVVYEAPDVQ